MNNVIKIRSQRNGTAESSPARYVHVTNIDDRGFIEFQFSIGDPNLYLEMMLPPKAFDEFCAEQHAAKLSDEQVAQVRKNEDRWRNDATDDEIT